MTNFKNRRVLLSSVGCVSWAACVGYFYFGFSSWRVAIIAIFSLVLFSLPSNRNSEKDTWIQVATIIAATFIGIGISKSTGELGGFELVVGTMLSNGKVALFSILSAILYLIKIIKYENLQSSTSNT